MSKKKKYQKILNIPVTNHTYETLNDMANRQSRSGASVVRQIIEEHLRNKKSFLDQMIKKTDDVVAEFKSMGGR